MGEFAHRGVIEGFYGRPYSHGTRLWWVERLGEWGLDRYVHAPKDDPLHRAEWRTPYPASALSEFADLIECGHTNGVDVGFALSPGLSMVYSSADDMAALARKLGAFRERGARFFSLALDDVPPQLGHEPDRRAFPSLAAAHVAVAHALRESLGPDATLCLVPTDYMGTEPTDYLEEVGESLAPEIEVGWTGRTVVSPTVTTAEAARRAATLRRRLLLWDNYPVADGPMRRMLHLGPYRGRDADLAEHVSGVILNPMEHARASGVAVRTAAAYLADPAGYDAEAAWREAIRGLAASEDEAEALLRFGHGHRFSALDAGSRDAPLEAGVRALHDALAAEEDARPALDHVRGLLEERRDAGERLRELADVELREEIAPWVESHGQETRRMLIALDGLDTATSGASRLERALALVTMEGRLTRVPTPACASYGPRRVCYPQLVCMHAAAAAFGSDPVLYTDRCLADELVDLAARHTLATLQA